MADASVKILIEAEDKATATIKAATDEMATASYRASQAALRQANNLKQAGLEAEHAYKNVIEYAHGQQVAHVAAYQSHKLYADSFEKFGPTIEAVTDNVTSFAVAGRDVKDVLADEIAEMEEMGEALGKLSARTDALVEKTEGWIVKLKGVAGGAAAIIGTFTASVAVGKRIGDWILQTKQFEQGLKDAAAAFDKVNAGNLKRDTTVIDRQIELAKLQGKSTNEIREGKGGVADQLIDAGLLVEQRKAEKKEIDKSRTALMSERLEAESLLKAAEDRKEALGAIYDSMSDEVIAHEKAKEAIIAKQKATEDLAQAQFDMFNEYARMADEQNKADEKALTKANKDAADFFDNLAKMHDEQNKKDEKKREQEAKEADDVFNNLAKSYSDIAEKETADAEKQAKKALAIQAKLGKAGQATPGLQATQGRLLTGSVAADPQQKMVVSLQQVVDYMAAEQQKLDDMVAALKAKNNPTYNILP